MLSARNWSRPKLVHHSDFLNSFSPGEGYARIPDVRRHFRLNDVKREVIIHDYADMRVPVLARMAAKRRVGYQAIGYKLGTRDLFSDRASNEPT